MAEPAVVTESKEPAAAQAATGRARSLANLRPFQKGQSGCPGGRPKRKQIVELVEEELCNLAERQGMPREDGPRLVALKWLQMMVAKVPDKWAVEEFIRRRDGLLKQTIGVEHDIAGRLQELWENFGARDAEAEVVESAALEPAAEQELGATPAPDETVEPPVVDAPIEPLAEDLGDFEIVEGGAPFETRPANLPEPPEERSPSAQLRGIEGGVVRGRPQLSDEDILES